MSIAGVVLAGGRSSRYGKPKMFEEYQRIPFYKHSINAFANSGLAAIYIVTNENLSSYFSNAHAEIIIEKEDHNGPLYALSYAMSSIQDKEWFFVLAADLPFVTSTFVREMMNYTKNLSYDAIIPCTAEQEQPLLALYHRRCLPYIQELLASNRKSMRPLLQKVNVNYVSFSRTQMDFTNINRQEDWLQIKEKGEMNMSEFSHWNEEGRPKMVDISEKDNSKRTAIAQSTILLKKELYEAIQNAEIKKGDPLQVAQIAGIMAAKKTPDIIPMCHPIHLQGVDFTFDYEKVESGYELIIQAKVTCKGSTGVEMEALTAVSVASLTFYDMCKAVDKSMIIKDTFLLSKTGGKSGDYKA